MSTTTYVNDITDVTRITSVACCKCGLVFGMGVEFIAARREDHRWFYCPNGHQQHYSGDNEEERLRKQLRWATEARDSARSLAQRESRRRAAAQGQVTKIKRRVGQGVCPVAGCRRHFANVQAHVERQHPDFVEPTT